MRFGIYLPNALEFSEVSILVELASEAEAAGWDGFFIWDELSLERWPFADPWVALGAIAYRTERIRIGTIVTPVARRRPAKLARETASVDRLSNGRLTLGVGLGAPADAEFEFLGEDPDPRVRARKLDEGLEALVGLWSGSEVNLQGEYVQVRATTFQPTPVQRPRIPIWVGGWWPNKAPARRASHWDGFCPVHPGWPDEYLQPSDWAEIKRFISGRRAGMDGFDLVASGRWAGDMPPFDERAIRPYADAGVTWWLQQAQTVEVARHSIAAGPLVL